MGKPIKVTLHTSCHAKLELWIENVPKKLLQQLEKVALVELESEDELLWNCRNICSEVNSHLGDYGKGQN